MPVCALLSPVSAISGSDRGSGLCAHLHLAHDVEELTGRHGPDRFRDLVDGRLARLDRNALRQRSRTGRAYGRGRDRVPTGGRTGEKRSRRRSSGPSSDCLLRREHARASWSSRSAETLTRRGVVRVGKVETESPPANLDALQVPERRRGRIGVAVLAESEPFRFPSGVIKDESVHSLCQSGCTVHGWRARNAPERDDGADGRKDLLGGLVSSGSGVSAGGDARLTSTSCSSVKSNGRLPTTAANPTHSSNDSRSRQPTAHSIGDQAKSMQTHQRLPWTASAAGRTLALRRSSSLCIRVERERSHPPSIPPISNQHYKPRYFTFPFGSLSLRRRNGRDGATWEMIVHANKSTTQGRKDKSARASRYHHLRPPFLPPLPPFCCSRLSAPRPPVSFLIALRSLTRPLVSCRAFGASSDTRVRLLDGVAPIEVRIESAFCRSSLAETSLASNCSKHVSHPGKREKLLVETHLALDVLLATLALELVVKLAEAGRTLLGRLEHLLDFALALIPLRVLGRRVLSLLRGLLGSTLQVLQTLPLVLERARFPLVASRGDRVKVGVCSRSVKR